MKRIFYAYHGPKNEENFDVEGGYGVGVQYKWKNVNDGDLVYIVQKLKDSEKFYFCGIYEITLHYEEPERAYPFRFRMLDISKLKKPIEIDDVECGKKLPKIESKSKWSNFQNHFCSQGASFSSELDEEVVDILNDLLPETSFIPSVLETEKEFQDKLDEELAEAKLLTKSERQEKLERSNKKPEKVYVKRLEYKRNQLVVLAVLERANGICESCKKNAPFLKAKNNAPYLEVHHKDLLADGGDDTVENAIALCPNCHRERHFGVNYKENF